jgi:hypothetical protein
VMMAMVVVVAMEEDWDVDAVEQLGDERVKFVSARLVLEAAVAASKT